MRCRKGRDGRDEMDTRMEGEEDQKTRKTLKPITCKADTEEKAFSSTAASITLRRDGSQSTGAAPPRRSEAQILGPLEAPDKGDVARHHGDLDRHMDDHISMSSHVVPGWLSFAQIRCNLPTYHGRIDQSRRHGHDEMLVTLFGRADASREEMSPQKSSCRNHWRWSRRLCSVVFREGS